MASHNNSLNPEGEAALRYHNATKHSEISIRTSGHYLDWNNKPSPFKTYNNVPSTALPHNFLQPTEKALKAIGSDSQAKTAKPVDLQVLTELLFFSAGLTRRMKFGSERHYMRAASATGALYPIELYLITAGIPDLEAGVYHFNPLEFSLVRLREGDWTPELAHAIGEETSTYEAAIAFTSLAWRNSWKYQERSYRHWFWDSGVVAANLLATCNASGLPSRLLLGFVDSEIDRLLGLMQEKEATVALALIGNRRESDNRPHRKMPPLNLETVQLSKEEVDYPIIWETNKASEIRNSSEVRTWREGLQHQTATHPTLGPSFPLKPSEDSSLLANVILQRGSTRKFAQRPIKFESLSAIIDTSTKTISLDFLDKNNSLVDFYFISNSVEGLPPGSYFYNPETRTIEQLKEGQMRYVSGYLSLEQHLFSDASVVFFLMTDLNHALKSLGNRGYRAAQFEAGVRAGQIYLSSYAQGLGASGTTFYDDAVTQFFSPHAKDMSTMIAVGVGIPAYMAKPGKILPQF